MTMASLERVPRPKASDAQAKSPHDPHSRSAREALHADAFRQLPKDHPSAQVDTAFAALIGGKAQPSFVKNNQIDFGATQDIYAKPSAVSQNAKNRADAMLNV